MATNDESRYLTHEDLIKLAEQINCSPLTEETKKLIYSAEIDQTKSVFENLPESFDSVMGMPIPATLANAGKAYDGEITHDFKKENQCPYFQGKNELCGLDGRICLYDTETYPVCVKYKEGFGRQIPGLNGKRPTVPPVSELPKDPATNQPPFTNPFKNSQG
jgi:hypothetical protein